MNPLKTNDIVNKYTEHQHRRKSISIGRRTFPREKLTL